MDDQGYDHSGQPASSSQPHPQMDQLEPETHPREPKVEQNLRRGLVGGAIGAAIGAVLWTVIVAFTGFQATWMAVVIGLLAGAGVRRLGRGNDTRAGILGAGLVVAGCLLSHVLWVLVVVSLGVRAPFFYCDYSGCSFINRSLGLSVYRNVEIVAHYVKATLSRPIDLLLYAVAIDFGYRHAFRRPTEKATKKTRRTWRQRPRGRPLAGLLGALIGLAIGSVSVVGEIEGRYTFWWPELLPNGERADYFETGGQRIRRPIAYVRTGEGRLFAQRIEYSVSPWEEAEEVLVERGPTGDWCYLGTKLSDEYQVPQPPGAVVEQLDCLAADSSSIMAKRYVILNDGEFWSWSNLGSYGSLFHAVGYFFSVAILGRRLGLSLHDHVVSRRSKPHVDEGSAVG